MRTHLDCCLCFILVSQILLPAPLQAATLQATTQPKPASSPKFPVGTIVGSASMERQQVDVFAQAHGLLTLSDHLEAKRPAIEAQRKLQRVLEEAQLAWLSQSTDLAKIHFTTLTRLALEADWKGSQREAIFYAFARLAQTAVSSGERDSFLERAVALFPDLKVDPKLFPPDIVEAHKTIATRAQTTADEILPYEAFPNYRILLLNGQRHFIEPHTRLRIGPGLHRFTALSDTHPPQTEVMTAQQLKAYKVATSPLVTGSCQSPRDPDALLKVVKEATVLFDDECTRSLSDRKWSPLEDSAARPLELGLAHGYRASRDEAALPFDPSLEPAAKSANKSWLWIGIAALAVGTAVVMTNEANRNSERTVTPTSHQGL